MLRTAVILALALLQSSAAMADAPDFRLPTPQSAALEQASAARIAETLIAQGIAQQRSRLAPAAPSLADDAVLTQIARGRSREMAEGTPFAHQDDSGAYTAAVRVRARLGRRGSIGENILKETGGGSFDPAAFARSAVAGWMASPGHRENILHPDFRSSGIGVTVRGGAVFATQVFFGRPDTAQKP